MPYSSPEKQREYYRRARIRRMQEQHQRHLLRVGFQSLRAWEEPGDVLVLRDTGEALYVPAYPRPPA
jgi:hypothetical protein